MKRTAKEFKEQVEKHEILRWDIHDCFICGYHCGFIFDKGKVFYDSSCDCVSWSDLKPTDYEDVVAHYNMQDSAEVIAKMDVFWKGAD